MTAKVCRIGYVNLIRTVVTNTIKRGYSAKGTKPFSEVCYKPKAKYTTINVATIAVMSKITYENERDKWLASPKNKATNIG